MESTPPPGTPHVQQPQPPVGQPPQQSTSGSGREFKLGLVPVLALLAVVLVAGFALGRVTKDSGDSNADSAPSAAQQAPQTPPDGTAAPSSAEGQTTAPASELGADADAKSAVITAAQAMETCATDNNGQYSSCRLDNLVQIEPTLKQHTSDLEVSSTSTSYTIKVDSETGNEFTWERLSNGSTKRTCTEAGSAGCQPGQTW